jgi:hypothetical protein
LLDFFTRSVTSLLNAIVQITVEKKGPWGGDGGISWDIKVASQRLESVMICCGTIIDALAFSYWDRNGRRHTTQFWGGTGGSAHTVSALFKKKMLARKNNTYFLLIYV